MLLECHVENSLTYLSVLSFITGVHEFVKQWPDSEGILSVFCTMSVEDVGVRECECSVCCAYVFVNKTCTSSHNHASTLQLLN